MRERAHGGRVGRQLPWAAPPRNVVTRYLRWFADPRARTNAGRHALADAVKAVAAGDEIAFGLARLAVGAIAHPWAVAGLTS